MTSPAWVRAQLDDIRAADRWRATRSFDAHGPAGEVDPDRLLEADEFLGQRLVVLQEIPEDMHPLLEIEAEAQLFRGGESAVIRMGAGDELGKFGIVGDALVVDECL